MITTDTLALLKKHYGGRGHNNDWNEQNLGFGFYHYAMIRNLKPDYILCVGSQRGFVPAVCALACKDNAHGKVLFVDAGLDKEALADNEILGQKSWGGVGVWKKATREYWQPLGVENFIELYCTTTEKFAADFQDRPVGLDFGYMHIDGDHSYEGVSRDFDLFWPMLEPGGFMTMHDIATDKMTDWGKCGVKDFWNDLVVKTHPKHTHLEYTTQELPLDCGLGILQKGSNTL